MIQSGGAAGIAVVFETIVTVMKDANIGGTRSVREQFKMIGLADCNVIHCNTLPCCLIHYEFHYAH